MVTLQPMDQIKWVSKHGPSTHLFQSVSRKDMRGTNHGNLGEYFPHSFITGHTGTHLTQEGGVGGTLVLVYFLSNIQPPPTPLPLRAFGADSWGPSEATLRRAHAP